MKAFLSGLTLMLVACYAVSVGAQTTPSVAPDQYLVWSQPGPSLAAVRTYRYTIKVDNGAAQVVTPTCQGTASPFDCGILNPGPAAGAHSMTSTYAIPLSGGGFSSESPTATCNWITVSNPTQPQTNFRWMRLVNGVLTALKALASNWWA